MSEYEKIFSNGSFSRNTFLLSEFSKAFLAGSISGTISTVLFQPLDLLKTQIQRMEHCKEIKSKAKYNQILEDIQKNGGICGFWRGLSPSLLRSVPSIGLYFASLQYLKGFVQSDTSPYLNTLTLGVVARTITCVCVIPVTVIKTRVESGTYAYSGMKHALRVIYVTEGLRGLTSGLTPTILRDAPYSGLYLMFYSNLKRLSKVPFGDKLQKYKLNLYVTFSYGIISGCLASLITHPVDVIKTKMQLYPKEYKNVKTSLVIIYKRYGIKGYGKGLLPRLLRRTFITAMTWTVYEWIAVALDLK